MDRIKMVIVARRDLGMTAGKLAAQAGHAVLGAVQATQKAQPATAPALMTSWNAGGAPKIVLAAVDEEHLRLVKVAAAAAGIATACVIDAGCTQVPPGTWTCLALGPAPSAAIDAITGKGGAVPLKLFP